MTAISIRKSVLRVTLVAFLCAVSPARTEAATIDTLTAIDASRHAAQLARVSAILDRADVQQRLEALGVEPAAAAARVASLTQAELATLADRLEQAPAGGDILALIGAVFVVLLILELTGVIDIFKKT